jgi:hypothetical protein
MIATPSTTAQDSPKCATKKITINKKKLQFAARKQLETDSEDDDEPLKQKANYENLDIETLKALVEEKKAKLEVLERYKVEKVELINLTAKWKQAGLDGLDRLNNFVTSPTTYEEMLDSFKIPHETFL